jgi:hypothetical protein
MKLKRSFDSKQAADSEIAALWPKVFQAAYVECAFRWELVMRQAAQVPNSAMLVEMRAWFGHDARDLRSG